MHPHIQKLLIFALIAFLLISWSSFFLPRQTPPSLDQEPNQVTDESPIYNQTLGVRTLRNTKLGNI